MNLLDRLRNWARSLKAQLVTLWFAAKDPRTPLAAKLLATLVVAYAFSPIDLIPDFIPVLGYLDDVIIVPLGIALCLRMVPPVVLSDSRRLADDWLAAHRARPKNYLVAGLFVLIWIALAYAAWRFATGWRIQ